MKLYHGTSEPAALKAITQGLKPRRLTRKNNWKEHNSHIDGVYLTTVYGAFFGINAIDSKLFTDKEGPPVKFGIIEVETDRLNPFDLVPDEDCLEQLGRDRDDLPDTWSMGQRTKFYRNHLKEYRDSEAWRKSIDAMGTCAHLGTIPISAMTRVAFVDIAKQAHVSFAAMDAVVSVKGYRFAGDRHKALMDHIFDEGPTLIHRDGIELNFIS